MQKVAVVLPEGKFFDLVFSEAVLPNLPHAVRVPADFSTESTLGAVCNALENAELVIADLSSRNPNVMYQLGFSHGIGKRVLLLSQHLEAFPFDKGKHVVIGYGIDREFLREEIAAFLRDGQMRDGGARKETALDKFTATFGDILARHNYEHRGEVKLENPTTFILLNQDMDLALVQDLARKARELGLRLKLM